MSNWDYIIERLSSIRPAKTIKLSDMKTDDDVWWEEPIKVDGEAHYSRIARELALENAAQEKTIADLENKISFLNAELNIAQDELIDMYEYSNRLAELVPKKKLKKFWNEQKEKS